MLIDDFNSSFGAKLEQSEYKEATNLMMSELANIIANNKEDVVELLNQSDIPTIKIISDQEIIDKYVDNIGKNKKLALGTAILINLNNKTTGFDGEQKISDKNVKAGYALLHDYFSGEICSGDDGKVSLSPDPLGAIAGGVSSLANLGSKAIEARQQKKAQQNAALNSALDIAKKKQETRSKLMESLASAKNKVKNTNSKTWWIVGGIALGLAIITGIVIYVKKK